MDNKEMEEKIIDEAEKVSWEYHRDTSGYDEYPNDHYSSSINGLRATLCGITDLYLSLYEINPHWRHSWGGNFYNRLVCIKSERLYPLYRRLEEQRHENEEERRKKHEKEQKEEKERKHRQGLDKVIRRIARE